jgi:hypothetical protein
MVSLQYRFGIATSQTLLVAVTFAKRLELLCGEAARTGVPRSPPLAAIIGFGLPDFLRIFLGPLLAASNYPFALTVVVLTPGSVYAIFVLRCPSLLILGYLFFVFFLILSACFDSMGQVRPGFLMLGILLYVFTPVLPRAHPDTKLASSPTAVPIGRGNIELREFLGQAAPFTCFVIQVSK